MSWSSKWSTEPFKHEVGYFMSDCCKGMSERYEYFRHDRVRLIIAGGTLAIDPAPSDFDSLRLSGADGIIPGSDPPEEGNYLAENFNRLKDAFESLYGHFMKDINFNGYANIADLLSQGSYGSAWSPLPTTLNAWLQMKEAISMLIYTQVYAGMNPATTEFRRSTYGQGSPIGESSVAWSHMCTEAFDEIEEEPSAIAANYCLSTPDAREQHVKEKLIFTVESGGDVVNEESYIRLTSYLLVGVLPDKGHHLANAYRAGYDPIEGNQWFEDYGTEDDPTGANWVSWDDDDAPFGRLMQCTIENYSCVLDPYGIPHIYFSIPCEEWVFNSDPQIVGRAGFFNNWDPPEDQSGVFFPITSFLGNAPTALECETTTVENEDWLIDTFVQGPRWTTTSGGPVEEAHNHPVHIGVGIGTTEIDVMITDASYWPVTGAHSNVTFREGILVGTTRLAIDLTSEFSYT